MKEAANWLIDINYPIWDINKLTQTEFENSPLDFVVMWKNKQSIATLLLTYEDTIFWPELSKNSSGFIHKLSIRREFAGQNLAKKIIEFAIDECIAKNIYRLRLECDSKRKKLCNFYESLGFKLIKIKLYDNKIPKNGVAYYDSVLELAYYELNLQNL